MLKIFKQIQSTPTHLAKVYFIYVQVWKNTAFASWGKVDTVVFLSPEEK